MKKKDIESSALSGLPVLFDHVARVSRVCDLVTLKNVWKEGGDARIWAAVKRAALQGAQALANDRRRSIDLYNAEGNLIAEVEPERSES